MPSPKRDTSSHNSSDDHSFDGPDEYEVEYDEERPRLQNLRVTLIVTKLLGFIYMILSRMKHLLHHTCRK